MDKEKLIFRELDDNIGWMRTLFQHYLSWYTFFVTANLFALSWVFTKDTQSKRSIPLSIMFIYLNLMGIVTARMLGKYVVRAEDRNATIIERLNTFGALEGNEKIRSTFPVQLAKFGFLSMWLGLLVFAILWLVVMFYF